MAKAKKSELEGDPVNVPKLFARGAKEFRHDLFRSSTVKMKRNTSWQKGVVTILDLDHVHIFHSHDSAGRVQQYSNTVGGHFHEVSATVNADGEFVVKCGPPMRSVVKKRASGAKRVIEAVRWKDGDALEDNAFIVDNHRHEFTYEGSETLSGAKVKALQQRTQAVIAEQMPKIGVRINEGDPPGADDPELDDVSIDE